MEWKIGKQRVDTVEITIWDDEPNSSEKEAYLDLVLNRTGGDSWGNWGTRYMRNDHTLYQISKTLWDNEEFQKKYFLINLML